MPYRVIYTQLRIPSALTEGHWSARGRPMSPNRTRRALNELEISVLCERSGVRKFGMPSESAGHC